MNSDEQHLQLLSIFHSVMAALTAFGACCALIYVVMGAVFLAFGYALSCTELSPAFVAIWYSLGIALAGALGAVLGPRILRW